MKSFDLDFELFYDLRYFSVTFDTEGPHKNLLMSVTMDGYPIDTVDLRETHKILYAMIETRMRNVAEEFWKQKTKEAFSKIHTYDSVFNLEALKKILNPFL